MVSRVSSWVGVAALAFGAALSGCGSAGSKSAPAGAVTEKGQHGVYFLVSLPKPTGGTIRSSDGQIACGSAGTACGPARYDWTATATLTAQADAGYTFFGWAGDCGGQ
ncbi:MAG TPA: hypothetical protein VFM53_08845, partial [Anaeromyxobacteraceae bacterium]|nr:hypothetical protein [Anaeromyxobacteraceae bacterium]